MSRPLLFQKRGRRTLVVASRYNSTSSTKTFSKKNSSSKENISPEPFKAKPSNSLSSSLTHKFANLKLDMHSDSDCEVIEINQKVTRDSKIANNKFRRPSPKPELPNEKACNPQRSFRRPSPKTNRFSEFDLEPTKGRYINLPKLDLSVEGTPELNDMRRNREKCTNESRALSSTRGRYINLPKLELLSDRGTPELNDIHRNKKKCTNGFRAPSPTKGRYINLPKLELLSDGSTPELNDMRRNKKKCTNGFRAPSPTKGRYINLPKLDLLSDEGTPEPNDMRRNREDSADLKKKCPYCNETLPDPLPPRIRAYLESPSKTRLLSLNTGHSSNIVDQFEFCRLHDAESHIVPDGLQKNYPLVIDFNTLPNRIKVLFPELLEVATGKIKSLFRDLAMDAYNELGKARARKPTVVMGRFQKFLPGYYGSKGSSVIFSTLVSLFIESKRLTLDMTKPQEPLEYLNQVLVPETAIRLIAQDRGGISLKAARKIMEDSIEFGMYVHDVEEEEDDE
ncbi:5959_t:CDS:2 [Dentiscutata erythropus]|uniref:Restriction of telomere capping protein 4 n=1 Tax=Dentiscutata erythropus TaxID=1348616 RepID=A0A9N9F3V0_9GLOM|nr:5959_t:CDS:2 [Dentiscutata erythropus]